MKTTPLKSAEAKDPVYYVRTVVYKTNHEILPALQYTPLYNISHSEKWSKKQAAAYNGARTVYPTVFCACKKIGDISDTHLERDISVSSLYPMQPPR